MLSASTIVLRDAAGQNWMVRIYHDEGIRQLYTTRTDEIGENSIKIKTFNGLYKIKISTTGKLITYPIDSIG